MNTYLMMFTVKDLIILGIILAVVVMSFILWNLLSGKRRKKEIELAEREADFYCDLYYAQLMKEAILKYKAYIAKGYNDKLPSKMEAIRKDRLMQEKLDQTDSITERKKIFEEFLPTIMLAIARCKAEGIEEIPKKEAMQLKRLMKEYGISN